MNKTSGQWKFALTYCVLTLCFVGSAMAQDSKDKLSPDRKIADQRLFEALRDIINRGADLFNGGDQNGCFRVYQGALLMLRAEVEHHPDVIKTIDAGLTDADKQPREQRAFALRKVLDDVRTKINPNPAPKKKPDDKEKDKDTTAKKTPTKTVDKTAAKLWDRLGGKSNVEKVVDDWVAVSALDARVNFTRGGKIKLSNDQVTDLKEKLVSFISEATGEPERYVGLSMKESHKGMGITDAEFDAAVDNLKKAFQKHGAQTADVEIVLKAIGDTRKDIVEPKQPDEKPLVDKKLEDKKLEDKKLEDKKLEDDKKKLEDKKLEDKKFEDDKKLEDKKLDDKKLDDKKLDDKQLDDKKLDDKKIEDDKQPEDKKLPVP